MRFFGKGNPPPAPAGASALDLLREHPIIAEAMAATVARKEGERAQHAAALRSLQADADAEMRVLRDAAEATAREETKAARALALARQDDAAARGRLSLASDRFARQMRAHEAALEESADPAIDRFVDEMGAVLQKERGLVQRSEMLGRTSSWTLRKELIVQSNADSLSARAEAIRAAIGTALAMKREVSQQDVPARLDALREALPRIKSETTVGSRRPPLAAPEARERYKDGRTAGTVIEVG